MKLIELTRGKHAVVDDEDFEWASKYSWFATTHGYAARGETVGPGKQRTVYLHREILGLKGDLGQFGDHIDGNRLNNVRSNLRTCTRKENNRNARLSVRSTSGLKGAHWKKEVGRWSSTMQYRGKSKHLGYFDTAELAHEFYCLAADLVHGEFANHG